MLLKVSVMVTTAPKLVGVTHRIATPLHYGVIIVKTIAHTKVAAVAAADWADYSRTAKALATLVVTPIVDVKRLPPAIQDATVVAAAVADA